MDENDESAVGSGNEDEADDYFSRDGDDSSDEEDNNDRYENFDFNEAYQGYVNHIENNVPYLNSFINDEKIDYFFMTNAIGLKLLLHPSVNNKYYEKKSDEQFKNQLGVDDDEINEWLNDIIKESISTTF